MQSPYYHPEPRWWLHFGSLVDFVEHVLDRLEQHLEQLTHSRGHF